MLAKILIQDAYRLAQIIPEIGDAATESQLETGLRLLNNIISEINITGDVIALLSRDTFTLNSGASSVFLTGYIDIMEIHYPLGNVRMRPAVNHLQNYFKFASITNASGLPVNVYAFRTVDGLTLEVFFSADQEYSINVFGVKKISTLDYNDDIAGNNTFYIPLLLWMLSKDLRLYDQLTVLPEISSRIAKIEKKLRRAKPQITSKNKTLLGRHNTGMTIPDLVLGRGWTP